MAKWCKIRSEVLLIIDKKSHIGLQMTRQSSTLDDLEGH